ncbi:MAG: ABC transporter permease [Anaerolineae bacterium]|nr:ABC transporter permease [Anaerolineae bacterium]
MVGYVVRRIVTMIPMMVVVSILSFVIIQLPPGDFLTSYIANLEAQGEIVDEDMIANLRARYGHDEPIYVQYLKWVKGMPSGNFGMSFTWKAPVADLIWDRLLLTLVISLATMLLTWVIAFPVGIYSAVFKYSFADYLFTFLGFLGMATPSFLLALVLMILSFLWFNQSVGGLFSSDFVDAAWSLAKVLDLLKHLWLPVVILGLSGTASLIRVMRANLLDELNKPYVTTARAKGLPERKVLLRYPVRIALNPFVSTLGWQLPHLVSGSTIVAVVLNLPSTGPLLLSALVAQDMYLAGTFIMMLSGLTIVGTLLSDILLAWLDPRIRLA